MLELSEDFGPRLASDDAPAGNPPVTERQRGYLERIATSSTFARSMQLRRLLLWLGAKSLEGGAPPSEYEVARFALNRPETFDPQTESLVRKEMTRLRNKLRVYYASEGETDDLVLRCDRGYQITFEPRCATLASLPGTTSVCLLILPLYAPADLAAQAESFYAEFISHASGLPRIELVAQTTARRYTGQFGDVRTFAADTGADFILEGTAARHGEHLLITLWLANGRSGRTRRLCRLTGSDLEDLARQSARLLPVMLFS